MKSVLSRNSILFINTLAPEQVRAITELPAILKRPVSIIVLRDLHTHEPAPDPTIPRLLQLEVDFTDLATVKAVIQPYVDDLLSVVYKDDASAAFAAKIIPHVPGVVLPRPETLEWATEKTKMRAHLRAYDKLSSPKYMIAADNAPQTINRIERTVGYPLIVKPSGLTSSLLITVCYYREELEKALGQIVQNIAPMYGNRKPEILVEQFMDEGTYYSIDAYVGPRGAISFTPPVYGKTGRDIGFDDFFGYMRMTPTLLSAQQLRECKKAATAAIRALKMRSSTCHIELMHTTRGWKIIELGPRIGGFRHELYDKAFGINHGLNDLLVRIGEKPIIPKRQRGYAAAMQFYPRTEGKLRCIQGLEQIEKLASLQRLTVLKHNGDDCLFAKHGGSHVLEVVLFNPRRSELLADIRRIEQNLEIETDPSGDTNERFQSRLAITGA